MELDKEASTRDESSHSLLREKSTTPNEMEIEEVHELSKTNNHVESQDSLAEIRQIMTASTTVIKGRSDIEMTQQDQDTEENEDHHRYHRTNRCYQKATVRLRRIRKEILKTQRKQQNSTQLTHIFP